MTDKGTCVVCGAKDCWHLSEWDSIDRHTFWNGEPWPINPYAKGGPAIPLGLPREYYEKMFKGHKMENPDTENILSEAMFHSSLKECVVSSTADIVCALIAESVLGVDNVDHAIEKVSAPPKNIYPAPEELPIRNIREDGVE